MKVDPDLCIHIQLDQVRENGEGRPGPCPLACPSSTPISGCDTLAARNAVRIRLVMTAFYVPFC